MTKGTHTTLCILKRSFQFATVFGWINLIRSHIYTAGIMLDLTATKKRMLLVRQSSCRVSKSRCSSAEKTCKRNAECQTFYLLRQPWGWLSREQNGISSQSRVHHEMQYAYHQQLWILTPENVAHRARTSRTFSYPRLLKSKASVRPSPVPDILPLQNCTPCNTSAS